MGPFRLARRDLFRVAVAGAFVGVAACTSGKPKNPLPSNAPRLLTIGATATPATLDMSTNPDAAIPQALLYNVYETLVKVDAEGTLRGLLAVDWQVSDDGKTYTFNLQPKAKFASGTPVNGEAVKTSIDYMRSSKASPVSQSQLKVIESVEATGDHVVTVKLNTPSQFWLYSMTSTAGIIIDPAGYDTMANEPKGSGPFAFKEWKRNTSLTLKKNTSYWGTPGRFDEVTFLYYADPNAMNAAMLADQLDIISNLAAPQALSQFASDKRFNVIEGTTNGEVVLGFNNSAAGLKDVRVRKAISHAIDRKALMDAVWEGKGTLIGSMVPPTDPWYEDLSNAYPFDPEAAKKLLAEAGVKNLKLRLRVPTLPYATGATQIITSQLKDVGITVITDELEFPGRWIESVYTKGDYDMTIIAHVEARDIVNWANPQYYWHYNNPEFAKLIADADKASKDESVTLLKQAAKMLSDTAAGNFLFLLPSLIVSKTEISGIAQNATTLSFDVTTIASKNG